jgi:DNA-binding MarR family transcriptional regulator
MMDVTPGTGTGRRRLVNAVRDALREARNQLGAFTRRVSAHVELKDIDLECLDLLNLHGPLSPTALARRANLHPATMTGILDRLERGGWIVRERAESDRRAVVVRGLRTRGPELYGVLAPMNRALDEICAGYTDAELELIAGFLRRVGVAGHDAAKELADAAG